MRAYPEVDAARVHVIYNGIDLAEYQKTSATDALLNTASIPRALCSVRRAHHAAEGRDASGGCGEASAAGMQVVLCAGAPDTPEIAAEMRAGVEAARA